jgi:UDP-N-acetylglucosamine 2-epimerase (non-hydrolysing)
VRCHEPLGFHDYHRLQLGARAVVSDSDTLPEEASFYAGEGEPLAAVCIRSSTERPEAMECGCFTLAGIDTVGLLQAVELSCAQRARGACVGAVDAYRDENVSDKVVNIIQSYTGVVMRDVWHRTQGGEL